MERIRILATSDIHGYITLTFIPVWFIVGLFFEKVRIWLDSVSEIDTELSYNSKL